MKANISLLSNFNILKIIIKLFNSFHIFFFLSRIDIFYDTTSEICTINLITLIMFKHQIFKPKYLTNHPPSELNQRSQIKTIWILYINTVNCLIY